MKIILTNYLFYWDKTCAERIAMGPKLAAKDFFVADIAFEKLLSILFCFINEL